MPELERLKSVVSYNPDTGDFTWLISRGSRKAGTTTAGTLNCKGYMMLRVFGVLYQAHRLAWVLMTGEWPTGVIDHKNGVTRDNAWSNLREVPQAGNLQNRRACSSCSTVGLLGAQRSKGRFKSSIKVGGKVKHLGSFGTAEEASAAYFAAKKLLHPFYLGSSHV